jgi:hypothetical protein
MPTTHTDLALKTMVGLATTPKIFYYFQPPRHNIHGGEDYRVHGLGPEHHGGVSEHTLVILLPR